MKGKRERERKRRRGRKRPRGKLEEGERGAASWDGRSAGALRKRMKEGKEALSVGKMNSESRVRRCA